MIILRVKYTKLIKILYKSTKRMVKLKCLINRHKYWLKLKESMKYIEIIF